jgi:hypothetical protein
MKIDKFFKTDILEIKVFNNGSAFSSISFLYTSSVVAHG